MTDAGERGVIGLVSPGEMGGAIGLALRALGHPVVWASDGRGPETARRAADAGLRDVGTVAELTRSSTVVLSVCPPHAAHAVAESIVGFSGLFVDMNAISPATTRAIAALVTEAGASYVDGGIIGPPPRRPGRSRLYFSGVRAGEVADLFAGTPADARVVSEQIGAASALKMAYAGWTKGSAALLLAVRELAQAEGVEENLLAEWAASQPGLADRVRSAESSAATKGWRWIGEMEEIASAMTAHDLPAGFHTAAAEVFRSSSSRDRLRGG